MKYQKEIQLLQSKLSETTDELEMMNRNKIKMQEQLKNAFMRGLCAMNLEAMNVLQPSDKTIQDGVNNQSAGGDGGLMGMTNTINSNLGSMNSALNHFQSSNLDSNNSRIQSLMTGDNQHQYQTNNLTGMMQMQNYNMGTGDVQKMAESLSHRVMSQGLEKSPIYEDALETASFRGVEGDSQVTRGDKYGFDNDQLTQRLKNSSKMSKEDLNSLYDSVVNGFQNKPTNQNQQNGGDEGPGVVILRKPLPQSKEHLWRDAPIIGNSNHGGPRRLAQGAGVQSLNLRNNFIDAGGRGGVGQYGEYDDEGYDDEIEQMPTRQHPQPNSILKKGSKYGVNGMHSSSVNQPPSRSVNRDLSQSQQSMLPRLEAKEDGTVLRFDPLSGDKSSSMNQGFGMDAPSEIKVPKRGSRMNKMTGDANKRKKVARNTNVKASKQKSKGYSSRFV